MNQDIIKAKFLKTVGEHVDKPTTDVIASILDYIESNAYLSKPGEDAQLEHPISIAQSVAKNQSELSELIAQTRKLECYYITGLYILMQERDYDLAERLAGPIKEDQKALLEHYKQLCAHSTKLRPGYAERFLDTLKAHLRKELKDKLNLGSQLKGESLVDDARGWINGIL